MPDLQRHYSKTSGVLVLRCTNPKKGSKCFFENHLASSTKETESARAQLELLGNSFRKFKDANVSKPNSEFRTSMANNGELCFNRKGALI